MSYLKPMMTNINLPHLKSDLPVFSFFSQGKEVSSLTHQNANSKVHSLSTNPDIGQYNNILNASPIFYPCSFLSFLASLNNKNYSVIPGSYKLESIFNYSSQNNSKTVFLESGLTNIQLPTSKVQELAKSSQTVQNVVVFGSSSELKSSNTSILKE